MEEEKVEERKPHISASQLNTYSMCAESYRRRYIEGEIVPPGIAMLRGTGVHGGAKINFSQKVETHEDLKKSDIVDASVAAYEDATKNGVMLSEDEESRGAKVVLGETKDKVVSLSELFADDVAPKYQPVIVEQKQRISLTEDLDLLVIMDLADDNDSVVDLKTAGKKKSQSEVETSEQLSLYALAYKAITGKLPKDVRLETLVDKKVPEAQMLKSRRSMDDLVVVINRLNAMIAGVSAGIFMPCSSTSWKCNPKWCGFYRTCPYVKKK